MGLEATYEAVKLGKSCLAAVGSPARIEKCQNKPGQKWEFLPGGGLSGAGQLKESG